MAARLKSRLPKIAVIGKLKDSNLETTTASCLLDVASTLFARIATPKILYFNCGVILEGKTTSIKFLRKLRLFICISQKDLNKKTSMLTKKLTILL